MLRARRDFSSAGPTAAAILLIMREVVVKRQDTR